LASTLLRGRTLARALSTQSDREPFNRTRACVLSPSQSSPVGFFRCGRLPLKIALSHSPVDRSFEPAGLAFSAELIDPSESARSHRTAIASPDPASHAEREQTSPGWDRFCRTRPTYPDPTASLFVLADP